MVQQNIEDNATFPSELLRCPLREFRKCTRNCMWLVNQGGMGFCAVAAIAAKGAPNLSANAIPAHGLGAGE